MRIISGTARGRKLKTLAGDNVRPTSDKVKEGIFSAIQFDIEGRRFLDLFAGSGQMGLEALSRGAENATFIDSSAESVKVCKENITALGFEKESRLIRSDALSFLSLCSDNSHRPSSNLHSDNWQCSRPVHSCLHEELHGHMGCLCFPLPILYK